MSINYIPAKLLVCLVGRHKGEPLVEAAKSAGARGGTIAFARTVGDNPILQALSLADVHQDVVFTLMRDETDAVMAAIRKAAQENPKKFKGYALVLDVSGMMTRNAPAPSPSTDANNTRSGRTSMQSELELITVITNAGFADDVMAAARKAGATGGTILNARGTGTEEDVKFFGITLVPEKEMLIIVSAKDKVKTIIDAVTSVPKLNEPGGGIVYTMPVQDFMVLGK